MPSAMTAEKGLVVSWNVGTTTKHDRRPVIVGQSKTHHDGASANRIGAHRCGHITEEQ
jgi:hypothetical protein